MLEVPLELPLDAALPARPSGRRNELLDEARAIGDAYGVDVIGRLVRARRAGRAIVEEAERRDSEIVVIGAPRRDGTPARPSSAARSTTCSRTRRAA